MPYQELGKFLPREIKLAIGAAALGLVALTGPIACNDTGDESYQKWEDLQRESREKKELATWEAEQPTPDTSKYFPAPTKTPAGYNERGSNGTGWGEP